MEKLPVMYMLLALLIFNISLNLAKRQDFMKDFTAETKFQCPEVCQCHNFQVICPTLNDDIQSIPSDTRYM